MYRFKVWGIAYAPMFLGIIISTYVGLGIGGFIMSLSLITIPIAIKMEQGILVSKGIDYSNGSPTGNFIAKFFGAIFISGAIWLFGTMLINIIKLQW